MYGEGKYNMAKFTSWFNQFDKNLSGSIEKSEFVSFLTKVARTEMFGHRDISAYEEFITEGRHHISKLVEMYKLNKIDYLSVCDLTRKIYRCFHLDSNANLDKFETK